MCDLSKGIEAKGIQKGIQRERLHSLKTLMQTMLWTADQAMDALKIGGDERERLRSELCR